VHERLNRVCESVFTCLLKIEYVFSKYSYMNVGKFSKSVFYVLFS
jgi:hypothetical protein